MVLSYGLWWRLIRALSEVGCTHSLASVSAGSSVTSYQFTSWDKKGENVGIFAIN